MTGKDRRINLSFFHSVKEYFQQKLTAPYKKSYSQCGEDLIINWIFDILEVHNPRYLDIGAHHPTYLSNTNLFYELGSKGVNIEPDPFLFKEIDRVRRRDVNLNVGLAKCSDTMTLNIFSNRTLNTFSNEQAASYKQQGHDLVDTCPIDILTFEDVMERYFDDAPDLVSLDVEGMDEEILKSIDFSRHQPLVFCIETLTYSRGTGGVKIESIDHFMSQHGYLKYADTFINTIYVLKSRWDDAL